MRFDARPTRQATLVSTSSASGGNQSSRGPGRTDSVGSPAGAAITPCGRIRPAGRLRPDGQHVAVAQGRRAEAGQQVVGTAAERCLHREAAADGDVGADAVTATAQLEQAAGGHLGRPAHARAAGPRWWRSASAPVTATSAGSAKRSAGPSSVASSAACARVVPDDAVPELERPLVGGSRGRDPELRQAGTGRDPERSSAGRP